MFIARSITTSVCLIFFLVCIIAMDQLKWLDDGREVWSRNRKIARLIPIAAFPVCALFVFFLVYIGLTGHVSLLDFNEYTHSRMGLSVEAIKNYGIKPFGTAFDQIGAGGSTVRDIRYNFVDSTYVLILVRYGWVTFVAIMISWIYMAIKVVKSGNRRLALAMTIVAVHSISEHHFPEINYNIFLAMPFATFGTQVANKEISLIEWIGTSTQKRKKLIKVAVIFLEIIVTVVLMPFAFSWLRTAFHGHDYSGGGNREIKVLVILIGLCIAVLVLLNNLSRAVADYIVEKSFNRKNLIFSGLSFCVLAVVFFKTNIMIEQVGKWHFDEIADESYFVRLIEDSADGRFYVDTYPECYDRIIGGVSRSFVNGEDLARFANTTVLVDSELDSSCFFSRGFLYFPISEKSAVYTNDKGVIKSLEENGYKLFGFYTGEKNVDMAFESSINSLPMTESGGLTLDGMAHSLIYGPYIDMNDGKYLVSYDLKIDPVQYTDDYEVITLKVNTYWGENTIAQKAVYRSYFDEDGELLYELPFTTWSGKAVEFLAFTPDGQKVEIESIAYKHTPDYDVHFVVDKKGRKTHEEYYDIDGKQINLANGSMGADYGYDQDDNIIKIRYLGADMKPLVISGGYAEIHRDFSKNGLVTKEEYFDENGNPTILAGGQNSYERSYDKEGNILSERYFGVLGEKILLNGQYHEVKREYDEENRLTSEFYFGLDGNLITLPNGYCSFTREYDDNDNITVQMFNGIDGNLTDTAWGYAGYKRDYNENKKVIREEYLGTDGKLQALSSGQAIVEREYDGAGNVTVEKYYDEKSQPILLNDKYHMIVRRFNSSNQIIHEEYYDEKINKLVLPTGQASVDYGYDQSGNRNEYRYFDVDGNPVLYNGAYWMLKYDYNEKKQVVFEYYYDLDGNPVALSGGQGAVGYDYDEKGNRIMVRYYDTHMNPVMYGESYGYVKLTYNEKNKLCRKTYYNLQDEVVNEEIIE
ncbi:hypothetical protein [Butyrivibrio sp. AE2015]|uniref:hypothetical protein n=1 Tax=Butyrivibrio sp. AE2015 TaxID=1280663 RepID=UPI0012DCFC46|nr:hypothetical protein [Butyrivibrio sp. AE2015]